MVRHLEKIPLLCWNNPIDDQIYHGVFSSCSLVLYYFFFRVRVLLAGHGPASALAQAIGSDFKGKISVVLYAGGLALAFVSAWLGVALYTIVALLWLCPDRRIEQVLAD